MVGYREAAVTFLLIARYDMQQPRTFLTLMYSMGHTAVASIPPAMHPADMAKRGFFFCAEVMMDRSIDRLMIEDIGVPKNEGSKCRRRNSAAVVNNNYGMNLFTTPQLARSLHVFPRWALPPTYTRRAPASR
eukprot:scaffold2347_cov173-Amphora_coffeaeformis.AAC.3